MEILGLYIYPLKGGAAVPLTEAEVTLKGLQNDRILMAINPDTRAIMNQSVNPRMALVKAVPDDTGITLSAPDMPDLRLSWSEMKQGNIAQIGTGDKQSEALALPDTASAWLSRAIGETVVLVYQPPDMRRVADQKTAHSVRKAYPLLVTFSASLDDLNRHIAAVSDKDVEMDRFRPNIVIKNDTAWEEDGVSRLQIGKVLLDMPKPCVRCVITTIDQSTAVKQGLEPLRTLATFRFSPDYKGVLFGENAVPAVAGKIKVGDTVKVALHKKNPEIVLKKNLGGLS